MPMSLLASLIPVPETYSPVEPGSVEHILHAIRTHLEMDVAFASQVAGGTVTIRNVDMVGNAPMSVGDVFPSDDGYCQRILDGRIPYLIQDTGTVGEVAHLPCTKNMPIGSHLSVPLRLSDGRIYGTFCCFSSRPNPSLNHRDLKMMHAFAELAAAQIEARMREGDVAEETRARIKSIIEQDDLPMVFQPIYDLGTNEVVGLECLARFPDSETRSPDAWFSDAAAVGLQVELELTAVRSALRALPYLPKATYLAINVSPAAVISGRLERLLEKVMRGRVVLEVTEHAIVSDYVELQQALEPLRKHVRIAIDDAGAGYSGLRHMLDVRPDIIKLDMSLTRGIDKDPARHALATALVTFARRLGTQIVAEGIEASAELETLKSLRVECGQGYYLRRPMPLMAAAQFLLARQVGNEQHTVQRSLAAGS